MKCRYYVFQSSIDTNDSPKSPAQSPQAIHLLIHFQFLNQVLGYSISAQKIHFAEGGLFWTIYFDSMNRDPIF